MESFNSTKKLGVIVGFDYGIQQVVKNSSNYASWLSPVIIMRYSWKENWALALRGEYYEDISGVIIETPVPGGFRTSSASLNLDYSPVNNVLCRVEGRYMHSADAIYPRKDLPVSSNLFFVASINMNFGAWLSK